MPCPREVPTVAGRLRAPSPQSGSLPTSARYRWSRYTVHARHRMPGARDHTRSPCFPVVPGMSVVFGTLPKKMINHRSGAKHWQVWRFRDVAGISLNFVFFEGCASRWLGCGFKQPHHQCDLGIPQLALDIRSICVVKRLVISSLASAKLQNNAWCKHKR